MLNGSGKFMQKVETVIQIELLLQASKECFEYNMARVCRVYILGQEDIPLVYVLETTSLE